jgi:Cft2 family RNA processing exonuclease
MRRFIPFGGGHQIGASAYYLELDGFHFLIDAGVQPGKAQRKIDFDGLARLAGLERAAQLDAIFVTHGHLDHIGGLLDLLTQAPHVPLYLHPYTWEIARTLFERMPGIQDSFGRRRGYLRFLDAIDYNRDRQYDAPFRPFLGERSEPVEVTFLNAGHLPGSACIRFRGREGAVMLTGDFNDRSSLLLTGTSQDPAYEEVELDLLVLEGTYAGRPGLQGPGVIESERLATVVSRVIERGGTVVIPAFALGRSQEVLALLARSIRSGEIPPIPVWYDGMTSVYCRLYERFFPGYLAGSGFRDAMGLDEAGPPPADPPLDRPAVIVASSGMVTEGSVSARYVAHVLGDARNAVILTGYQAEGTVGAQLQAVSTRGDRPEGLYVGDRYVRLRAELFTCRLSAHADHEGLVEMVRRTRAREVALIHRHRDQAALDRFVTEVAPTPVVMPKDGEVVS